MHIEEEIFKKTVPNYESLLKYGFKKDKKIYIYKEKLIENFDIIITIENKKINGKVIDNDFKEEYTNYRIENQNGSFSNMIREKFIDKLKDIKEKCFISKPFIFEQSNRIANLILKKYNKKPIYKWDNNDSAVFENNEKWFGIIMNIDRNKISNLTGEIEILNIKLSSYRINSLIKQKGFYKAYHMNKKNWITITLDNTLSDDTIMELLEESFSYTIKTIKSSEWVMPLNPKFFNIFNYFDNTDIYYWDRKKSFKKNDIVYMYITKPVGCIMYKCIIDDITSDFTIVRKICKYEKDKYNLEVLKKYGLTSVRSTRHIPLKLKKYIEGEV